eukprot:COSAG05_NODE_3644_length_1936_cov_2.143168_2_plen_93_part_00
MFWDGDTIHRGSYRQATERLTLHNAWGSVSADVAAEAQRRRAHGIDLSEESAAVPKKTVVDSRFLHWSHPGTREFLAEVRGGAIPGLLASAW